MFSPQTRTVVLRTGLPPEEVKQRLKRAIGAPRGWDLFAPRGELYLGSLEANRFKVQRQGPAKNPYRPVISGELISEGSGSRVRLYMRPPNLWILSFVLATFAGGLALLSLLTAVVNALSGDFPTARIILEAMLLAAMFIAVGYALTSGTLKHEYENAARYFTDLLQAEVVEELTSRSPSKAA